MQLGTRFLKRVMLQITTGSLNHISPSAAGTAYSRPSQARNVPSGMYIREFQNDRGPSRSPLPATVECQHLDLRPNATGKIHGAR